MKSIIIYYSRSGHTEKLAQEIRKDTSSDILKVEPTEAYGNYISSCMRVSKERRQKEPSHFQTPIPDLTPYDVVFLGYPIWAQDVPAFIVDFISQCNIKGKIIIPFATYGVSDIKWTMHTLNQICKGAEIKLPFSIGIFKKDNYESWIAEVRTLLKKTPH